MFTCRSKGEEDRRVRERQNNGKRKKDGERRRTDRGLSQQVAGCTKFDSEITQFLRR